MFSYTLKLFFEKVFHYNMLLHILQKSLHFSKYKIINQNSKFLKVSKCLWYLKRISSALLDTCQIPSCSKGWKFSFLFFFWEQLFLTNSLLNSGSTILENWCYGLKWKKMLISVIHIRTKASELWTHIILSHAAEDLKIECWLRPP